MTRYIVILTLALTAGLSSGNAYAQQANDDSPRVEINGFQVGINTSGIGFRVNFAAQRNTHDGFLQCMDLWFALVDAGYTEDEAFEMVWCDPIDCVSTGTFGFLPVPSVEGVRAE
ncbi:MAG: hypothetical protein OSA98_23225 [Rubripirellula sp.]|nr:hypothetical protein [Rubripirellula sp.]